MHPCAVDSVLGLSRWQESHARHQRPRIAFVVVGLSAGSTSVVAAGLEFLGDVLASIFVFVGMLIAPKPADSAHPDGTPTRTRPAWT